MVWWCFERGALRDRSVLSHAIVYNERPGRNPHLPYPCASRKRRLRATLFAKGERGIVKASGERDLGEFAEKQPLRAGRGGHSC